MRRRHLWLALVLVMAALRLTAAAQTPSGGKALDAKTMKAALRTTAIEEGNFIERVLALTSEGKLPPNLVTSTFEWARKKPQYRFQYFKHGLIARAAKLGIDLSKV